MFPEIMWFGTVGVIVAYMAWCVGCLVKDREYWGAALVVATIAGVVYACVGPFMGWF